MVKNSCGFPLSLGYLSAAARLAALTVSATKINGREPGTYGPEIMGDPPLKPGSLDSQPSLLSPRTQACEGSGGH